MRFRLFEGPTITSDSPENTKNSSGSKTAIPVTDKQDISQQIAVLQNDSETLANKQSAALNVMTELNLRNCPISYVAQDTNRPGDPVFLFISYLPKYVKKQGIVEILKKVPYDKIAGAYRGHVQDVVHVIYKISSNKLSQLSKLFTSESLYTRNDQDFNYTLRVLEVLLDNRKAKKYFKDPSIVKFEELLDGDQLKPAGISPKDDSTKSIYGVIAAWTANKSGASKESKSSNAEDNDSYVSFEEAEIADTPRKGRVIKINSKFVYDPTYTSKASDHWRPMIIRK